MNITTSIAGSLASRRRSHFGDDDREDAEWSDLSAQDVMIVAGVLIAIIGVVVVVKLIRRWSMRNRVNQQWQHVCDVLGERHAVAMRLVQVVEPYAQHHAAVDQLRTAHTNASAFTTDGPLARHRAESQLGRALTRLIEVVEADPRLSDEPAVRDERLSVSVADTRVGNAVDEYNSGVRRSLERSGGGWWLLQMASFVANFVAEHLVPMDAEFFELEVRPATRVAS